MAVTSNLAVTYRPRSFAEVAGQGAVVEVLRGAASLETPPQQLLLAGPSGTGKTTLARLFAAALFCPAAKDGAGCGECESCVLVMDAEASHPDVLELDAASNGGVDQVRELAGMAALAPALASRRVFIIDEAHGLTREGAQAFLRLLEEPPSHTVWVLATTDPQKLPVALRSRCLQLSVTLPTESELGANLHRVASSAGWAFSDDVAQAVLAASDEELGVRGTVTTLAKVAPICSAGQLPTATQLQALLGVSDPAQVRTVVVDAVSGRSLEAVQGVTALLKQSSPAVVRTQLAASARSYLSECSEEHTLRDVVRFLHKVSVAAADATAVTVAVGSAVPGFDVVPARPPRVATETAAPAFTASGKQVTPSTPPRTPAESAPLEHVPVEPMPVEPAPVEPVPLTSTPLPGNHPDGSVSTDDSTPPLSTHSDPAEAAPQPGDLGQAEARPDGGEPDVLGPDEDPFYVPMDELRSRARQWLGREDTPASQAVPLSTPELLTAVAKTSPRLALLLRRCELNWSGSVLNVTPFAGVSEAELGAALAAARDALPDDTTVVLSAA